MEVTRKADVSKLTQEWLAETATFLLRPLAILRNYRREDLRPDLVAGLTIAVVMLPQAIAYALIAELPPQTGIFAAVVAAVIGALWGSSIHLHTGPTNAASLLVFATLIPLASPGSDEYILLAGLLAVMVGVMRLLMGLARLGVLVNFVSDSVIIGFTAGAGILISVNQLRPLLRLEAESSPSFYRMVIDIVAYLPTTHFLSFAIGGGTIIFILVMKRLWPDLPGTLLSMIVASIVVGVFHLERSGVVVLGELPRTLPPLTALPLTDFERISSMLTGATAIAIIGLIEAISIARAIAAQSGQNLDSNQEFVGQGLSNIAAGFFSGYTCSGSFTRSAVNFSVGAKSPMAAVFSAGFVLLALFVVAPYAVYLPRAALAGVIILTAYNMVDISEMKRIWHTSLGDSAIMIATLLATLLLPLQFAVLAGIVVSILRFLMKTSVPRVDSVVPDENFRHFVKQKDRPACPQLGIITVSGPLYFGAVQHVEKVIRENLAEHPGQRYLLLRMHLVDHSDVSGLHMLEAVMKLYHKQNGDVYIAGLREPVRRHMQDSGFETVLGEQHFLARDEAIGHLFHRVLEPSICIYECPVRVFAECQALPKWDYGERLPNAPAIPEYDIESWLPSHLKEHLERRDGNKVVRLIDVREPKEYNQGHIAQAELLPMRLIPEHGHNLPKDETLVVVCRIGRRSRLAATILKDMGHENVYNLQGGILAWEAAGYPLAVE